MHVYFKVLLLCVKMCVIDTMCMEYLWRPQEDVRPLATAFIDSIVSYSMGARNPTESLPRAEITPNY